MNYKKKYLKYKKKYLNAKKHGGSNQGLYNQGLYNQGLYNQDLYNEGLYNQDYEIAKTHLLNDKNPKILKYKKIIFGDEMYNFLINDYLETAVARVNIHNLNLLLDYLDSFIKEKLHKRQYNILYGLSKIFENEKVLIERGYKGTYFDFLTKLENIIGINR